MSLYEALRGAKAELAAIPSPGARLHRLAGIASTFCKEIFQQFLVIPYAVRALRTYHSLPRLDRVGAKPACGVSLIQGVKYGQKHRNVMDVYVPAAHQGPSSGSGTPVALFCHGGVWAAGDKWHYAPMATRLAEVGVLTCVMHYSLYPDALVPEMVAEVSAALSWTLDNAHSLGGDPSRVSLVGHSAGAQLAAMALLHRAKNHVKHSRRQQRQPMQQDATNDPHWQSDGRMPNRLIGMAGVYDLTKHFEYEAQRNVEELSTMKRAAGGIERFASVSPVVILAHALREASTGKAASGTAQPVETPNGSQIGNGQERLRGEAVAHRIGFERPRAAMADRLATVEPRDSAVPDLRLTVAEARLLPPTVLMSSCADIIVPWYESAEMFWMLHDCGVRCKHLVYTHAGHADFVTTWRAPPRGRRPSDQGTRTGSDLPDVARDLLAIVSEQTEPEWV